MIRNIFWYFYFWLFMTCSLLMIIPVVLFALVGMKRTRNRYIRLIVSCWARSLIAIAGGKVTVTGLERIPPEHNLCFIANHQGSFDIPLTLAYLPGPVGFIAKKELLRLPIVNFWMQAIGCVFIDRSNKRAAVEVIRKGSEKIREGQALILFPEGTRSRGPQMHRLKHGSLKLPIRAGATIIPVSISGSYKLLEKTGRIAPGTVQLTIHDPVDTSGYTESETGKLADHVEAIIRAGLEKSFA